MNLLTLRISETHVPEHIFESHATYFHRSSTASGGSESKRSTKATERKEQYKQVRAHVKKDDGRMQAYGWSLPAQKSSGSMASTPTSDDSSSSSKIGTNVPVPVPVYCRPLMEKEPGMKVFIYLVLLLFYSNSRHCWISACNLMSDLPNIFNCNYSIFQTLKNRYFSKDEVFKLEAFVNHAYCLL